MSEFPSQDQFLIAHGAFDIILGIDEVGRGCLAGPVVAAASAWAPCDHSERWVLDIADSKKLSPIKRTKLVAEASNQLRHLSDPILCVTQALARPLVCTNWAKASHKPWRLISDLPARPGRELGCIGVEIGAVPANVIDEMNIWNATQAAMNQALMLLMKHVPANAKIALIVDGSLPIKLMPELQQLHQFTCVAGDSYFKSVSFASVVAKVCRDQWMEDLATQLCGYGFESHKGYGSLGHFKSLRCLGVTPQHRRSFLKNL